MIYEAKVAMWDLNSVLPRDAATNTVFFNDTGLTSDPDGLAQDIAEVYGFHLRAVPIEVKLYDAEAAAPRDLLGTHRVNWGNTGSPGNVPRELSLCLSFYGEHNRPSERGRIYIPYYLLGAAVPGERPGAAALDRVVAFATEPNNSFPDVGGLDVKWVVWSRKNRAAHDVTAGWCDDEWDTVRSRGLRPSTRTTFTRQG